MRPSAHCEIGGKTVGAPSKTFAFLLAGTAAAALAGCTGGSSGSGGDPTPAPATDARVATVSTACELLTDDQVAAALESAGGGRPTVTHRPIGDNGCQWEGRGTVSVSIARADPDNQNRFMASYRESSGAEIVPSGVPAQIYYEPGRATGWVWTGGQYRAQLSSYPGTSDEANRQLMNQIAGLLAR
ncbi:hypothetical protein CGZ95_02205 [Enemella evansiae]|nr:hypothetical protein CGZ95_02205 [Enemella evansiae]